MDASCIGGELGGMNGARMQLMLLATIMSCALFSPRSKRRKEQNLDRLSCLFVCVPSIRHTLIATICLTLHEHVVQVSQQFLSPVPLCSQ